MAGFLLTCWRDPSSCAYGLDEFRLLAEGLSPDNITANRPLLRTAPGLNLAILNPVPGIRERGTSVCLGSLLDSKETWWRPGTLSPDGSYAICRSSSDCVEVLADDFSSRPVWYAHTPDAFVASTSQRAIVRLLGDFKLNRRAVSWMLSAGCLGPEDSWDERLQRVGRGMLLRLDRHSWKLSASPGAPESEQSGPIAESDQARMLGDALAQACEALDLDMSKWLLPLSGGKDSRSLLLYLSRAGHLPHCITWGLDPSRLDPGSDASIAPAVAEALGATHEYLRIDRCDEPLDAALGRYAAVGEGLVDHVSAYTDGLDMWAQLFGRGVAGVIRGEIAMGWYVVKSPEQGRRSIAPSLADYSPRSPIRELGMAEQIWPADLQPLPHETAQQHADRLYFDVRLPRILAPLNLLKSAYVEVAEPLLSRSVVEVARRILLTGRAIPVMQVLVEKEGPPVPLATSPALQPLERCVREKAIAAEVRRQLSSGSMQALFSSDAVDLLIGGMDDHASEMGLARKRVLHGLSRLAPTRAHRLVSRRVPLSVPPFQLAFRAYIAHRTVDMLAADAALSGSLRRAA